MRNAQALKEMLFALKICTQSIAQQAFTKPARTGKEICLALIYKIIDVICLINIEALLVPQIFKTLYAQRIVYHDILLFRVYQCAKIMFFAGKAKKIIAESTFGFVGFGLFFYSFWF